MTFSTSTEFISLRKAQLQSKIHEAIALGDYHHLSSLKGRWAHRYGVETFYELENIDENLLFKQSVQATSLEVDETKGSHEKVVDEKSFNKSSLDNPFKEDEKVSFNHEIKPIKDTDVLQIDPVILEKK